MPEAQESGEMDSSTSGQLLLRTLYDEQSRLRAELDRLRGDQQEFQKQLKDKPAPKQEGGDEPRKTRARTRRMTKVRRTRRRRTNQLKRRQAIG
jgi:hypothetical protein